MYFQTIAFWKPNFWPRDLLMQPIRTIWTILAEDYPGTIPVEFGQIPICGSRKEFVWSFPYIIQCKRTSRWCYIPNMKALGLVVSDKKILKVSFQKPIYWHRDILMQPTGTVWTTLIGDHPGIISVKFGQNPISGSREDVVWSFPYINQCKFVTPGAGSILTPGA